MENTLDLSQLPGAGQPMPVGRDAGGAPLRPCPAPGFAGGDHHEGTDLMAMRPVGSRRDATEMIA
jgi:hypothetical protein